MSIKKFYAENIPQADKEDVVTGINAVQFYLKKQKEESAFKEFKLNSLNITKISVTDAMAAHLWDFTPHSIGKKEQTRGFIISEPRKPSGESAQKTVYIVEIERRVLSRLEEQPYLKKVGRSVRETLAQVIDKNLIPKILVIVDFSELEVIVYSLIVSQNGNGYANLPKIEK